MPENLLIPNYISIPGYTIVQDKAKNEMVQDKIICNYFHPDFPNSTL